MESTNTKFRIAITSGEEEKSFDRGMESLQLNLQYFIL